MLQGLLTLPIVLPVLFWAAYHYHKDRHLPEPLGNLALCFGLGLAAAGAVDLGHAQLDRGLHLRDRPVEEQVALAAEIVGEPQLEQLHVRTLEAGIGGPDGGRHHLHRRVFGADYRDGAQGSGHQR